VTKRAVTQGGTSTERKALEHQGPVRTNGAGLLFKQAVSSAHRAAVDIRVHFAMLARGSEILGNCLRKVLRAALNGLDQVQQLPVVLIQFHKHASLDSKRAENGRRSSSVCGKAAHAPTIIHASTNEAFVDIGRP
jgi:hypothetical protein